jgi:hypothetical protein
MKHALLIRGGSSEALECLSDEEWREMNGESSPSPTPMTFPQELN